MVCGTTCTAARSWSCCPAHQQALMQQQTRSQSSPGAMQLTQSLPAPTLLRQSHKGGFMVSDGLRLGAWPLWGREGGVEGCHGGLYGNSMQGLRCLQCGWCPAQSNLGSWGGRAGRCSLACRASQADRLAVGCCRHACSLCCCQACARRQCVWLAKVDCVGVGELVCWM